MSGHDFTDVQQGEITDEDLHQRRVCLRDNRLSFTSFFLSVTIRINLYSVVLVLFRTGWNLIPFISPGRDADERVFFFFFLL